MGGTGKTYQEQNLAAAVNAVARVVADLAVRIGEAYGKPNLDERWIEDLVVLLKWARVDLKRLASDDVKGDVIAVENLRERYTALYRVTSTLDVLGSRRVSGEG